MLKNYFALLNLPVSAKADEVRAAMKKAAQQQLLDVNTLMEIRDVLFDNQKRPVYMKLLREQHPELFQAKPAAAPPPPQTNAPAARAAQPAAAPRQAAAQTKASAGSQSAVKGHGKRVSGSRKNSGQAAAFSERLAEWFAAAQEKLAALSAQTGAASAGDRLLAHKENRTLLVLHLIGAAALFLPWLRIPQGFEYQSFYGWNLAWGFLSWLTLPLFLLAAAQVWTEERGRVQRLAHLAVLPAAVLLIGLQAWLRLSGGYQALPADSVSIGTGLYVSIMIAVSALVYIGLIAHNKR